MAGLGGTALTGGLPARSFNLVSGGVGRGEDLFGCLR